MTTKGTTMSHVRTRSIWRRRAVAGIAVLSLSGLAACGGGNDDSDANPLSNLGSSSAASSGDASASESSTGAVSTDLKSGDSIDTDQMTDILKQATTSMSTAHMTMSMDMSAAGQSVSMSMEGDMQMKPLAEDISVDMGSLGSMQIKLVDGVMYIKSDMLSSVTGSGDTWAKITQDQMSSLGMDTSSITDPLASIEKISGAIDNATYQGTESVDGSEASHYQLTVSTDDVMSALGSGTDTSGLDLPDSMTEDLWINGDGQLTKAEVDMGSLGTVEVSMTKLGEPVSIEAPPASEVTAYPTS
ncbi:MAG: LppX_LprAFG lipoprotein [Nocardioides sp.]|uniref:DUF6612 family protein n=1 Tax=Nocardioides sp. TaxID=35761 RepID=UPI0039E4941C